MFRFEHPEYFYLLLALLPLGLAYGWFLWQRRRAEQLMGEQDLRLRLMPDRPRHKHGVKFTLFVLALVCGIIALANPQIGTRFEKVKREGVDIIVALDVSKSMLAEDVRPNRLLRARQFVSNMIDRFENDRVGLIVFAGKAYLQMPITVDYPAARLFLSTVNTEMVPTQGTAIGQCIRLAMDAFVSEEKQHKVLIIITDGETHDEDALDALNEATDEGIVVHTLGVGSAEGAPIPIQNRYGVQTDFKRDQAGNIVLSKLNESMLQKLAVQGNGTYVRLGSGRDALNTLMGLIASMEKKEIEERVFTDYEDQFQYFLILAVLLLTLEFVISLRRNRWLEQFRI